MLILNPRLVKFGPSVWSDVTLIAIDRDASRLALEWSDLGPHPVFADAPEQRLTIRVVQEIARDDLDTPRPGDQATLVFYTSPTGADARRRKVTVTAVVTGVSHELSLTRGTQRRTTLTALSPTGAADPVIIADASLSEI